MSKKTCELILKIGSLLAFVSFFIVSGNLYFPYVTGKQLFFNILIEILFCFWFYLIVKYPETQPRKSLLTYSLLAWLGVLLLSSIFGVDFNLSFWGDTERMLGWFSLVHFFAFYAIIITVFKSKDDWSWLLNGSVLAAVILSIYAFVAKSGQSIGNVNMMSNISTLGNATYVAGVMLFNLYFIFYLWKNTRNALLKIWYAVACVLVLASFAYANVSGSEAGLVISFFVFTLIIGFFHKEPKIKKISLSVAGVAVVLIGLAFVFRQAPMFDNNKLGYALREFSAKSTSLNARTFAWRAGWQGFLEKPILGFGWGNFAAPFDKYFKAGLYSYTPNEEYYDRAHNMIIEMLATAGVLGFLTYLGIFVAIAIGLFKSWKNNQVKTINLAIAAAIFIAYFIHNLAVFDSMANFICFMIGLAFVYWLTDGSKEITDNQPKKLPLSSGAFYSAMLIVCLAAGLLAYTANIRPGLMLASSVKTARAWHGGDFSQFFEDYKQTLAYRTPLDRDVRSLFINYVLTSPTNLSTARPDDVNEFLKSIIANSQANTEYNRNDYFILMLHAQLLELYGSAANDQKMIEEALTTINRAIANGGEHTPARLIKSDILSLLKRNSEIPPIYREVLALRPDYKVVFCPLAVAELDYGYQVSQEDFWKNFDNCLDYGNVKVLVRSADLSKAKKHYSDLRDQIRLKKLQTVAK